MDTDTVNGYICGSPSMAYDGENFIAVWLENANIYCSRVTIVGLVCDSNGISVSVGLNDNIYNYH